MNRMKCKNWFWGIFLLLAGVLIIAGQFGFFGRIGVWTILATVALAALFIQSLASLGFMGMTLSAALLYILYQRPLRLFYISPWLLLLAALLVGGGLSMLFRRRPSWVSEVRHEPPGAPAPPPPLPQAAAETGDDNHPFVRVRLGEANRYLHASRLENGQFYASLGSLQVYFDQAQPAPGGADIYLDCSLGSITLYVPRHWQVKDNLHVSLGDVSYSPRPPGPADENAPLLRLTGSVSLGSVEIRYI